LWYASSAAALPAAALPAAALPATLEFPVADALYLTDGPVTVTGATKQELRLAVDVSHYDEVDLRLRDLGFGGTASLDVRILTGMEKDDYNGYVVAATFSQVTQPNAPVKMNVTGLLKYLIWEVTDIGGASATFDLAGMLRKSS